MAEDTRGTRTSARRTVQSARSVVWQTTLQQKCRKRSSRTKRLPLVEVEEGNTEDEFTIDMVTQKIGSLKSKSESSGEVPSQLFATMMVNDKAKVKLQLDCGATCNLLPLERTMHESWGTLMTFTCREAKPS